MIAAVCLGFFGATLALVGMKCTRIGGSETTKARLTVLSGSHFVLSGTTRETQLRVRKLFRFGFNHNDTIVSFLLRSQFHFGR